MSTSSAKIAKVLSSTPPPFPTTSIALLDALKASRCKIAEVHISNIFRREEFRRHSYVSLAADGVISGFGEKGYIMAMEALFEMTKDGSET